VDTFAEIGLDRCVLDPADPVGWSSTVVAGLADRQSAVDAVQRAAQRYRQSAPLLSAATASTSNAPAS
jgi:hypothetical protein